MTIDIAYVDTIDACHLKCPTCARGVRAMSNTARKMGIDLYERIVAKIVAEGYRRLGLFSWTEPFLNRDLQDYVAIAKRRGLICELASTFSLRHIDNLEATLAAGVDLIRVSFSGFSQAIYEVNHVGGNVDFALRNLELTRRILDKGLSTTILVRFIEFDYNSDEIAQLREFAEELRFQFEVINGVSHPLSSYTRERTEDALKQEIGASGSAQAPEMSGGVCSLSFDQMTIDCEGDAYLCCAFPNFKSLKIGPYLQLSAEELLLRKYTHPFCRVCTMPRRQATAEDQARLVRAVSSRLRRTDNSVSSLTPHECVA